MSIKEIEELVQKLYVPEKPFVEQVGKGAWRINSPTSSIIVGKGGYEELKRIFNEPNTKKNS